MTLAKDEPFLLKLLPLKLFMSRRKVATVMPCVGCSRRFEDRVAFDRHGSLGSCPSDGELVGMGMTKSAMGIWTVAMLRAEEGKRGKR